jgi:hypothetical protein
MKPGRELDLLVAEKVMGYKRNHGVHGNVPFYSTDLAAAWEVVEKMKKNYGFELSWFMAIKKWKVCIGLASIATDTIPHSICLAALAALGVRK